MGRCGHAIARSAPEDMTMPSAAATAAVNGRSWIVSRMAASSDRRCARPGRSAAGDCLRGEAIAALAGARRAEAIVPAIEPDDRYSGIARREATNVAASRCRQLDRAVRDVAPGKAIVSWGADARLPMGDSASDEVLGAIEIRTSDFPRSARARACCGPAGDRRAGGVGFDACFHAKGNADASGSPFAGSANLAVSASRGGSSSAALISADRG
jgi:hypothetical protein